MSATPQPFVYASLTAFVAHYGVLRSAPALSDVEQQMLAAMRALLSSLSLEDRAALESNADDSAAERRRERALRRLGRELSGRGIISG